MQLRSSWINHSTTSSFSCFIFPTFGKIKVLNLMATLMATGPPQRASCPSCCRPAVLLSDRKIYWGRGCWWPKGDIRRRRRRMLISDSGENKHEKHKEHIKNKRGFVEPVDLVIPTCDTNQEMAKEKRKIYHLTVFPLLHIFFIFLYHVRENQISLLCLFFRAGQRVRNSKRIMNRLSGSKLN